MRCVMRVRVQCLSSYETTRRMSLIFHSLVCSALSCRCQDAERGCPPATQHDRHDAARPVSVGHACGALLEKDCATIKVPHARPVQSLHAVDGAQASLRLPPPSSAPPPPCNPAAECGDSVDSLCAHTEPIGRRAQPALHRVNVPPIPPRALRRSSLSVCRRCSTSSRGICLHRVAAGQLHAPATPAAPPQMAARTPHFAAPPRNRRRYGARAHSRLPPLVCPSKQHAGWFRNSCKHAPAQDHGGHSLPLSETLEKPPAARRRPHDADEGILRWRGRGLLAGLAQGRWR